MTNIGKLEWVVGMALIPWLISCSTAYDSRPTIGSLNDRTVQVEDDVIVQDSRQKAIASYREFLGTSKEKQTAPVAMRRLADLQIEDSDEAL